MKVRGIGLALLMSSVVLIAMAEQPNVSITAPASDGTVISGTFEFIAQITNTDENVNVLFTFTNGTWYNEYDLSSGGVGNSFSYSLNTVTLADGDYSLVVTATNGNITLPNSSSETRTFSINNVNDAPVLDTIDNKNVNEGQTLQFTVTASDPDGDPLTYSATNLPTGASFDAATRTFSWTPDYTQAGTYSGVHFEVSDGSLTDSEDITITVGNTNRAPVANNDVYSTDEDTPLNVVAPGVLGNDADADGDAITAVKVTNPSHGTVTLNSNGGFTYTPNSNYNGVDSFTYKANDGSANSNEVTVSIMVNAVNDAPFVAGIPDVSFSEDQVFTTTWSLNDYVDDVDTPDSGVTWSFSGNTQISVTINPNRTVTFSAPTNWNGQETITFTASDGEFSDSGNIVVNVNPVNDAPVVANIPDVSFSEDQVFTTTWSLNNYVEDVDTPDSGITWSVSGNPPISVTINPNRTVTFSAPGNWNGQRTITFTASDGTSSASDDVVVKVNPVNDAPVDAADSYSTNEDTALTVDAPGVLGNDNDVDGDTLIAVKVTDPSHGTVTLNSDGGFTYTPNANYNGADNFTYKAKDPSNAESNIATVTITVNSVNDAPQLSGINSGYSITEGQTLYINADYTDIEGDPVTFSDNSNKWNINPSTGVVSWNTVDGDQGDYTWRITITDNGGLSSAIDFTVHVGDSTPGTPANLVASTDNFWVRYDWNAGANTDWFNVSYNITWSDNDITLTNITWTNGSSATFINKSVRPHGWGNISLYGWNNTLRALSSIGVTKSTQIPNNPPVINNISENYTVFENNPVSIYPYATDLDNTYAKNTDACQGVDSQGNPSPCDILRMRNYTTKGDFNVTSSNYTKAKNATFFWTPNSTDGDDPTGSKIYNWNISASDYREKSDYRRDRNRLSNTTFNFTVTVIDSTPYIDQLNFLTTTGNFWVNHSWENVPNANSYNISHNGIWSNGTSNYFIEEVSPHGWSNITLYAYNTSSWQISTGVSEKIQVPNNNHTQEVIVNGRAYTGQELEIYTGQVLSFNITTNDADSDFINFATDASKGFLNGICSGASCIATYTWKPEGWDTGEYAWEFNSSDGWGSLQKETIRVKVKNPLDVQLKLIEPYVKYENQNENMNYIEAWRDASTGHVGKYIGYDVTFRNKEAAVDYLSLDIKEIYNGKSHSPYKVTIDNKNNKNQSCPDVPGGKITGCRMEFEINSTGINKGNFTFTLNVSVSGCINCTVTSDPASRIVLDYMNTSTISLPINPILTIKRAINKNNGMEVGGAVVINGTTTTITYLLMANSTVNLTDVIIHDSLYPRNNGYINITRLEANKSNTTSYDFPLTTDMLSEFKCEGNETCIINMATLTGYDPVKKVYYNDTDYVELCINVCYNGTFVPTPPGSPGYSSPGSSIASAPSGGGGGGGSLSSVEDFNNTERREKREMAVLANTPAVYVFKAADPVQVVSFVSSVSENDVPVLVEVLKNRSKFVGVDAPGKLYKYFNVFVGTSGFSKKISKGVVVFRVNNSWLEENGFNSRDISLHKYMDGNWVEKDTKIAETTPNSTYYASSVGNFSSFAIVAQKGGSLSSSMSDIPVPQVQLPADELENNTISASANQNLSSSKLTNILTGILGFALPKNEGTLATETLKLLTAISAIIGIYYLKRRYRIKWRKEK